MEFREVDLKQVVRASVETLRVQPAEKRIAVATLAEIPEATRVLFWETRHGCSKFPEIYTCQGLSDRAAKKNVHQGNHCRQGYSQRNLTRVPSLRFRAME